MNKIILLSISFFLSSISLLAQYPVRGRVFDAQTNAPLVNASVFIANTTKGVSTDMEGKFEITGLDNTHYNLVVSLLGYQPVVLDIIPGASVDYQIKLKPSVKVLNEVVVKAKKISKAQWFEYLHEFEEHFIGISNNAAQCDLENQGALVFDKEGDVLTALSDSEVVLRNNGLGYKVKILLQRYEFNSKTESVFFEGQMVYEKLATRSENQKKRWAKNRLTAYYGSKMHFCRALYQRRLNEEGFYFYFKDASVPDTLVWAQARALNHKVQLRTITDYSIIIDTKQVLTFNRPLDVLYIHEQESYKYQHDRAIPLLRTMQWSQLISKQPALVLPDGRIYPIEATEGAGYWSWELMSEELPFDYDPAEDLKLLNRTY